MVDKKTLIFRSSLAISFMNQEEQMTLLEVIKELDVFPSIEQAERLKQLSMEGRCSRDSIYAVLSEEKPKERKFVMKSKKISEYFPAETSQEEIEEIIYGLLEKWRESERNGEMS